MRTKYCSFIILVIITLITSCKDPEASFICVCIDVLDDDQIIWYCDECRGGEVQFTSTSINSETYYWDFGDGSTSFEENPFHYYDQDGTFNVQLVVSNNNGSDSVTDSVTICWPVIISH